MISSLVFILTFFFHGNSDSWSIICNSLTVEKSKDFCNGAILATSQDISTAIANTKLNAIYGNYLLYYPLCSFLAFFPFIGICYSKELPIKTFVILSIIFIIPLFIVGYDWGRWITIYVTLFTLLTFYLLQTQQASIRPFCQNHPILLFIIFIIYIFSWIIPHCVPIPNWVVFFHLALYFLKQVFFKGVYSRAKP